jgi:hypothetical protein
MLFPFGISNGEHFIAVVQAKSRNYEKAAAGPPAGISVLCNF